MKLSLAGFEEGGDLAVDLLGALDKNEVAGVAKDHEAGCRFSGRVALRVSPWTHNGGVTDGALLVPVSR
jgi:hypothetical protein